MDGFMHPPVRGVSILGTGTAFPTSMGRWVTNAEVERLQPRACEGDPQSAGLDSDRASGVLGFRRRFWTHTPGRPHDPGEATSEDLAVEAASAAIVAAGIDPGRVDLCIAASTTNPRVTSSLGTLVAGRLGLRGAAFEVRSGCSSAVTALAVAYRFLAGGAGTALVVAAETLSKYVPVGRLCYAAGDAGAAVVLGRAGDESRGLLAGYLAADGRQSGLAGVPGTLPPTVSAVRAGQYHLCVSPHMSALTAPRWGEAPKAVLSAAGARPGDLDAYVANQVNRSVLREGAATAGVPDRVVVDRIGEYANCGSASVLAALHDARGDGRASEGSLVLVNAVGGGLAWGGLLLVA